MSGLHCFIEMRRIAPLSAGSPTVGGLAALGLAPAASIALPTGEDAGGANCCLGTRAGRERAPTNWPHAPHPPRPTSVSSTRSASLRATLGLSDLRKTLSDFPTHFSHQSNRS